MWSKSISANRIWIASEKRRGKMIKTFHIVIGQKALVGGVACATFASFSENSHNIEIRPNHFVTNLWFPARKLRGGLWFRDQRWMLIIWDTWKWMFSVIIGRAFRVILWPLWIARTFCAEFFPPFLSQISWQSGHLAGSAFHLISARHPLSNGLWKNGDSSIRLSVSINSDVKHPRT